MFSKEFASAITDEVFSMGGRDSFHDTVFEATDLSLNEDELKSIFMEIPEELQMLALKWHLSDTQFRDDVFREITKYKKAYIFSINKLLKAR